MNIIKYYMETEAKNKETHMKKKLPSLVYYLVSHIF